jgi:hypothetical protein
MSVKKFKFVSPGVFTREIDQSQLPAEDSSPGPVIIGRLPQGPAMEPVAIRSFEEYVEVFGNPVPGRATGDVWRDGNYQGPTYAAYAAQAYLRNSTDGITVIRLAGLQDKYADTSSAGAEAGWETATTSVTRTENGGAFGLFLCQTGSGTGKEAHLAAVFYVNKTGSVELSGSKAAGGAVAEGISGLFATSSADSTSGPTHRVVVKDGTGAEVYKTEFNFDPSSRRFIRNVFNTNPQTVNTAVVPSSSVSLGGRYYWLGESYESHIQKKLEDGTLTDDAYGLILPFTHNAKANYISEFESASTGWFFAQDLGDKDSFDAANAQKLFKVHALEPGKWVQNNIKVSIQDLTYSRSTSGRNNYSTFTLVLRSASDTDKNQVVVERFSNLDLNPLSDNYIAKRIGDKRVEWNEETKVMTEYGEYDNRSKYIRIEVLDAVANGTLDPAMLPFGVEGPNKFNDVEIDGGTITPTSIIENGSTAPGSLWSAGLDIGGLTNYTASLKFPEMVVRKSSSAGDLYNQSDAYYGAQADAYLENENAYSSRQFAPGWADMVQRLSGQDNSSITEPMWRVTLDDIVENSDQTTYYLSGSRQGGTSLSANEGWQAVVDHGWNRFTAPLFGGLDGLDVREIEPFRNTGLSGKTRTTSYAFNTVKAAIEMINDPEIVPMNMATIPGITNTGLTRNLVETCEQRADALAIIDLPNVYTPFTEGTASASDATRGSVSSVAGALVDEQIDSSYGCTYYPWVQVQDTATSNSRVWVPPSVVALGTMASSAAQSEVWFAPAGFNRGGLSQGAAGLPVLNVSQKLTSRERDTLYEANINPIASFPNEGIVVFGQKTLQITPSALDRINVRRMMIFVKKQISIFANQVLFDQNVQATWNRFIAVADPFLASVQSRLGISEYKLILDETTTTPDLVDQNIMYAKIFIKPAKAIEYIALDFFITNQGASFED